MAKNPFLKVVSAAVAKAKDAGESQASIARRAKIMPAKLSDYLNQKADLQSETLARLCKVLGIALAPTHPK